MFRALSKTEISRFRFEEVWQKNLFLLAIAQFIAMVGMNGCVPFLPLFIRELGVNTTESERFWSGMVFAGPYFLSIIFVPIWGNLADRYGRKLMVVRAILGLSLAMFLMGFSQNVYQLFLLRVFQGVSSGFIAASLGFIVANTPQDKRGYAIGVLQSSQSAGSIVGPLFGGVISDFFGFRTVFFVVAGLCILSGTLIALFLQESNKQKNHSSNSLFGVFKYVVSKAEFSHPLLGIILSQVGIFLTYPILSYYIELMGAPKNLLSTFTGFLIGLTAFFNVLFAPFWGKKNDRIETRKILRLSSFAIGFAMILHGVVSHFFLLFPLRIAIGIFFAGLIPSLYSNLGKKASHEMVGSIMGFASSANLFGSLLAFVGSSLLASNLDLHWGFFVSGLVLFSISLLRI